ncbi:hypothetical protein F8M41_020174 [Gigaspora margarita]|uniref:Uncharacterized protein n=1 Tax=Gigaspora margarita TaxID=4874 RepID=A0A8H4EJX8_GIGMA|nr:hypothetical protein F8M41_020174 [Gigaspora margarita]
MKITPKKNKLTSSSVAGFQETVNAGKKFTLFLLGYSSENGEINYTELSGKASFEGLDQNMIEKIRGHPEELAKINFPFKCEQESLNKIYTELPNYHYDKTVNEFTSDINNHEAIITNWSSAYGEIIKESLETNHFYVELKENKKTKSLILLFFEKNEKEYYYLDLRITFDKLISNEYFYFLFDKNYKLINELEEENEELYDKNKDFNVKNNTQHKIINRLTKKNSNLSIENHQLKKEYENFKVRIKNLKNYSDMLNDILAQQCFSCRCEVKINNYPVMAKINSGCDGYSSISKNKQQNLA